MEVIQFEPTGRKKRIARFFHARCTSCGDTIPCPAEAEPWGWAKSNEIESFRAKHDLVVIEVKIIEKD